MEACGLTPNEVKAEEPDASAASGSSMPIVDEPASVRRLRHVFGGWTLLPHHEIELHELALGEAPEAAALDRAVVNEAILVTAVRGDESETLGVVEPFYFARLAHTPLLNVRPSEARAGRRRDDLPDPQPHHVIAA